MVRKGKRESNRSRVAGARQVEKVEQGTRTSARAAGRRQIATGTGKNKAPQTSTVRRGRTQVKKSTKALDKKGVKQKNAQAAKMAARQNKQNLPTKGARSVKVLMAKSKMKEEKKKMTVGKGKTAKKGDKKTAAEEKKKKFDQEVMREIDRLRSQEKQSNQTKAASPSSRIITRRARQHLLETKRKLLTGDSGKEVKGVKDQSNQTSSSQEDEPTLDNLAQLVRRIKKEEGVDLADAVERLRKCVSSLAVNEDAEFAAGKVLKLNILPKLVKYLKDDKKKSLHYDVAWILINIASGASRHTRQVYEADVVPTLVEMGKSDDPKYQEIALLALHNITGDCEEYRDEVLAAGIMDPLLSVLEKSSNHPAIIAAVNLLANLNRAPYATPDPELMRPSFGLLKKRLCDTSLSDEIRKDVCWTIAFMGHSFADSAEFQELTESQEGSICKSLVDMCSSESPASLITGVLEAIGAISSGTNDKQTQALIDAGALKALSKFFNPAGNRYEARAVHCLSNIAAGTPSQIQDIIDSGILPFMSPIIGQKPSNKTTLEAVHTIKNMVDRGCPSHIRHIADSGMIHSLCNIDINADGAMLIDACDALRAILKLSKTDKPKNGGDHPYVQALKESGGVTMLTDIQSTHGDVTLHAKISMLLHDFLR